MNKKKRYAAPALAALLALLIASTDASAQQVSFTVKTARDIAAAWPKEAREAADSMLEKYGAPDEITKSRLAWRSAGPWHEIVVRREIIDHRFPSPHKDALEQSIAYEVPEGKFDDLARFNGSIIAERTRGTLASRSQSEAMNFLALNLAHDIITNRKSVEEARETCAYISESYEKGEQHQYTTGLRFQKSRIKDTGDPDFTLGQ